MYPDSVFGYKKKIITQITVLKIRVTHDVISSNLPVILIVLTLHRSSVRTFLNARKSLGGHAKTSVASPLSKSNLIWPENVDENAE